MKDPKEYLKRLYITKDGDGSGEDESVHDSLMSVTDVFQQIYDDTIESFSTEKVTRVEVIDKTGRSYVNWSDKNSVKIEFQDESRTLKVFISKKP